jgi:enoyl-CoA hydratase
MRFVCAEHGDYYLALLRIMSNELTVERRGRSVLVTFTRPEIRNPLSVTVLDQLYQIVDGFSDGCLIFTGSGESFASGADLREIADVTGDQSRDFARYGQDLMRKISSLSQPTIAAINGFCFGGALDLALACDRRVASPNAKLAHPGTGLGIITGWGGTQRLPRLVGRGNALEMFFTASAIGAEHALRIGLVDEIADDALERAFAIAG